MSETSAQQERQYPSKGSQPQILHDPTLKTVTIGILLSVGVVAFDGLGVTTALPHIAKELGGLQTYGWAVSALMLASVIGTVSAGFIADRHGPKMPFVVGFGIFVCGLLVSGLASSWPILLLGRVVQGLGVGAIMSMAYVFVAIVYPKALQARALALLSGAWTIPALVGPMVSSSLAEFASWRYLFLGLVPTAFIAAGITVRGLPPMSNGNNNADAGVIRRLIFSTGLAIGTAVVLVGLEQDNRMLFIVMVGAGLAAVVIGLNQVTPEGTLVVRRGVPAGIATRAVLSMAFFGIETFLPLAMVELRSASTMLAGTGLAAGALMWVAGSMTQSRHEMRSGTETRRRDTIYGLLSLILGIAVIAVTLLSNSIPVAIAIAGWIVGGFGMGAAYNASTADTFSETEPQAFGAMSGTIQMAQTLGTAVIAGVGTAVLSTASDASAGMTLIFACTAAFAIIAIPCSLRIRREKNKADVVDCGINQ